MDDQLAMLLKTVIPLAGVALVLGLLLLFLPVWLVGVLVVVAVAVAANPKARAAIKKIMTAPPDAESPAPPDSTEKNK